MPSPQVNLGRFGQTVAGVSVGGNTEILAPTSGTTLQVDAAPGGGTGVLVNGSGTALAQITDATQPVVRLYDTVETFDLTMGSHNGIIRTLGPHDLQFFTNTTLRMTISSTGAVTFYYGMNLTGPVVIAAPATSVPALKSTGPNGNWAAQLIGSPNTNVSYGLSVQAGTTSSDMAIQITNQSTAAIFEQIYGDGSGFLGPSGPTRSLSWTNAGSFTIGAPTSGTALQVNSAASNVGLGVNGGSGTWAAAINGNSAVGNSYGLQIAGGTNSADAALLVFNQAFSLRFMEIFGDGHGYLGANVTNNLSWTAAGAFAIAAPTSGNALTITGLATGAALVVNQASGSSTGISISGPAATQLNALSMQQSGQSQWLIFAPTSSNSLQLWNSSSGSTMQFTNAGNVTISAPASGVPLTINTLSGQATVSLASAAGVSVLLQWIQAGQSQWQLLNDGGTSSLRFWNQNSGTTISMSNTGNVSIPAPSAGVALTIGTVAGSYGIQINGISTANQSFGLRVSAGTSSSDNSLVVTNQAGTTYFQIKGDSTFIIPNIFTTGSAANMFIDSTLFIVQRSTSSRRYKNNIRTIEKDRAREIVSKLRPVSFNSLCGRDNPKQEYFGLVAEEVAEIDPVLVTFDKEGRPESVQYDRVALMLLPIVQELLNA